MERNYSERLEAEIYKNFFGLKSNISLMDSNTQILYFEFHQRKFEDLEKRRMERYSGYEIAYEYQWKEKLML